MHDAAIARIVATLLLTTRSTAMMYYGEELGMVTSTPTRKEDVKDPIGITGWPKEKGRDGERTPMQWDVAKHAGFSTADMTWLPVAADAKTVNVHAEEGDPNSLLNWYKQLIALRRRDATLRDGALLMLHQESSTVVAYVRENVGPSAAVVVAVNCGVEPQTITLDLPASVKGRSAKTVMTNAPDLKGKSGLTRVTLPAYGSWVGTVQ